MAFLILYFLTLKCYCERNLFFCAFGFPNILVFPLSYCKVERHTKKLYDIMTSLNISLCFRFWDILFMIIIKIEEKRNYSENPLIWVTILICRKWNSFRKKTFSRKSPPRLFLQTLTSSIYFLPYYLYI